MSSKRDKILIVDDESFYIDVLVNLLSDDYNITVAKSGEQALNRADSDSPPDLILLDILMPTMDGYEVCRRLKSQPNTATIPIIFLTVKSEVEDEIKGFNLGASDYIIKPMSPPIVKSRIRTHLALDHAHKKLKAQNKVLEQRVLERTREIQQTQDVAIYCLASLAETRDNETGNHIRRTQHYVKLLAKYLQDHPRFRHRISDEYIDILFKSAPLHDIGKVGVPDRILLHPGKLEGEDWTEMKRHAQYGRDAILTAEKDLGSTSFLRLAREVAYSHHECWDGSGYPEGLKEDDIPLSGQLMAVADVYDALISQRVYKEAFSHEKAVAIIFAGSGTRFDPDIIEAFTILQDEFNNIAKQFADI
ncbi:MAG: two-component system response regulator [Candidatus Polarisedimenticolaceae bacterium]|nr:two-component system response regulator [Candidatus Polarisedimenticolaceae bacterium]